MVIFNQNPLALDPKNFIVFQGREAVFTGRRISARDGITSK